VKTRYALALAAVASFWVGVLGGQILHAQGDAPVYVVTLFDTGSESEVMKTDFPSLAPTTFQPFGGHYIIHFGRTVTFDGQPPNQIVVIAFDSMKNAEAWRASSAYRQLYDVHKIAKVRAFAVGGVQWAQDDRPRPQANRDAHLLTPPLRLMKSRRLPCPLAPNT